jgi:hypothetical protein
MDVWSRRIVGWTVAERESSETAARLVEQSCRDERVDPRGLVLHSDNGQPMRGSTMLATLRWLGIVPSFSRPHVSDESPANSMSPPGTSLAPLLDARAVDKVHETRGDGGAALTVGTGGILGHGRGVAVTLRARAFRPSKGVPSVAAALASPAKTRRDFSQLGISIPKTHMRVLDLEADFLGLTKSQFLSLLFLKRSPPAVYVRASRTPADTRYAPRRQRLRAIPITILLPTGSDSRQPTAQYVAVSSTG